MARTGAYRRGRAAAFRRRRTFRRSNRAFNRIARPLYQTQNTGRLITLTSHFDAGVAAIRTGAVCIFTKGLSLTTGALNPINPNQLQLFSIDSFLDPLSVYESFWI